jgi:hypothetical protein
MVDKVEIGGTVKLDRDQSLSWAQESTLRKLAASSEDNNEILKRLAQARGVSLDGIKKFTQSATDATDAFDDNAQSVRGATKKTRDYESALYDLRRSTDRYTSTINSVIRGTADPMQALPGMFTRFGEGLGAAVSSIRGLRGVGLMLGGLGAAAGAVTARFIDGADAYRQMINTGLIFDGTITGMISSVRSSGVSLQQASQIIQNRSAALLIQGETEFFSTVGRMSNTFSRFGMTMDQGAETLAELMDMQRLSGSLMEASQAQIIEANTVMLNQMQSQARLTGVSLRRQMEEQRRVAERTEIRLLSLRLTDEQREQQRRATAALTTTGMSSDAISGLVMQALTGQVTQAGAAAQQVLGPQLSQQLMDVITSGGDVQALLNQREFADALRVNIERLAPGLAAASAAGLGGQVAVIADSAARMTEYVYALQSGRRILPGGGTREEQAAAALRGDPIIASSTREYFNTVNNVSVSLGKLEATVMEAVEPAMRALWEQTNNLTNQFLELTTLIQGGDYAGAARHAARSGMNWILDNPELAAGAGALGAAEYARRRAAQARSSPTGPAPPPPPGGSGSRTFGSRLMGGAGALLGLNQLLSAGSAFLEGNYAETLAHAGLFLARKNPELPATQARLQIL